jgi:hypothetical protein
MYSILKPNYVYRNISDDIADHDEDYEAEEWHYNGRDVFRGSLDRSYEWNVYWLYNDVKRVGLAEHDPDHPEIFHALWFHDNPFSMLFQEEWKVSDKTLWSILSNEAYQDCLEDDFKTVITKSLNTNIRLMTPELLTNIPEIHECLKCGKKSLLPLNGCSEIKMSSYVGPDCSVLFVDDSYIMYTAPADSRVWSTLTPHRPPPDDARAPSEPEQAPEPPPPQPDHHHTPNRHSEQQLTQEHPPAPQSQ